MKNITKIIKNISLGLILAAVFSSCQDPILYHIRQEVKLEEATMLGDIYTIVRYTEPNNMETLYLANGNIYFKNAYNSTHGSWVQTAKPNGHVQSIAADSEYLYAFVTEVYKDDSEGETRLSSRKIFYLDKDGFWKLHPSSMLLNTEQYFQTSLMCTNAVQRDHRSAYLRAGYNVYKLNGDTYEAAVNPDGSFVVNCFSCAWLNGSVRFFTSFAACTDETTVSDPTCIFYGNYAELRKIDINGIDVSVSSAATHTITGVAVMNDSILVTTDAGAILVNRYSGKELEFKNLTSTLSTLYQTYTPLAVYPEKDAFENNVYASNQVLGTGSNSAQFSHQGLWSYYPSRGKWNIE